jgi:branched-chain amino acid transport system permease protein
MDPVSILLGGAASGMVLFIVSVGLSVTMGLMGFVNLAHGGFAMLGGYAIVLAMRHWGLDFFSALALAFLAVAALSVVLERLFYARLYRAHELDQVLFTIGLVFVMTAAVTLGVGPETQVVELPEWLRGQTDLGFVQYRTYSLALIVVGTTLMLRCGLASSARTLARASARRSITAGWRPRSVSTSGASSPLRSRSVAALPRPAGASAPRFSASIRTTRCAILVYFLIVVAVGGLGRVTGVFFAALLIGVLDFVLKINFPKGGTIFIYALTLVLLLWRPHGLFGRKVR